MNNRGQGSKDNSLSKSCYLAARFSSDRTKSRHLVNSCGISIHTHLLHFIITDSVLFYFFDESRFFSVFLAPQKDLLLGLKLTDSILSPNTACIYHPPYSCVTLRHSSYICICPGCKESAAFPLWSYPLTWICTAYIQAGFYRGLSFLFYICRPVIHSV